MILNVTRGSITMRIGEKTITIYGEGLMPMHGEPDYIIYESSVKSWDPPFEKEKMSTDEKQEILNIAVDEMLKKGMVVEIE